MKNYYFTFGTNHYNNNGTCMAPYWVRVVAADFNVARAVFIERFAIPHLPGPDKWSWQYGPEEFKTEFFPGGEYMVINQEY